MSDRVLALTGVRNFRDYGGYAAHGGAVRRGVLFRSAHFAEASADDGARLDRLGVAVIVDLRRPQERAAQPSAWPGPGPIVVHGDDTPSDEGAEPPHLAFLRQPDLSAPAVHAFMVALYKTMPFEHRHTRLFSAYFKALAEVDGGSVVHCAAGKDRTGIACALVLSALGVARETIMADYLLTNAAVSVDQRAPHIKALLEQHLGRTLDEKAIMPMLGVHEAFLQAAIDAIGDIDRYLETALGVDDAMKQRLRAKLLG